MKEIELKKIEKRWSELLRKPYKSDVEIIEKEELRLKLEKAYSDDEKPLLDDLKKNGFNFSSVWDLVNTTLTYERAVPLLIKHISRPYHIKNKEGIARSLAVKEAKGIACNAILHEYKNTNLRYDNYRWVLGNTMSVIVDNSCASEIIEIVLDEKNGSSREMLVEALGKIKTKEAFQVLNKLLSDNEPSIVKMASRALSRKGYWKINK